MSAGDLRPARAAMRLMLAPRKPCSAMTWRAASRIWARRAAPGAGDPGPAPPPHRRLVASTLLVLLVLALLAGAWALSRRPSSPGPLVASGTIEVEEVTLAAQAGGL